ncbi:MAG: hypothetical protein ACKVOH_01245 [Chlamydiales bacterium]
MSAVLNYTDSVNSLRPTCVCYPNEAALHGMRLTRSFNIHVTYHSLLCQERIGLNLTDLYEALALLSAYPDCVKKCVSLWFLADDREDFPVLTVNLENKTILVRDIDVRLAQRL